MSNNPVRLVRKIAGIISNAYNRVMLEDENSNLINANNPLPVAPQSDLWTVDFITDDALNDSNKLVSVPAGQLWQILSIHVELTTTATIGDRQLAVRALDDATDLFSGIRTGIVQAASLTYQYEFAPALADLTAVRDTVWLMTPLPPTWFLTPGCAIRIWDNKAIAPAADDMIVKVAYAWRPV